MLIRQLTRDDVDSAVALWDAAGLVRPWNPPRADYERALLGASSTVLGLLDAHDTLMGTVMVGHDGHRGWLYYLAVRDDLRGRGYGRQLTRAAEEWLRDHGAVKVHLMVRSSNAVVNDFYDRLDYDTADVLVRTKWL